MNIQLIKGSFTQAETVNLLNQFIQIKIKFHENKIEKSHNEEDIKMRERRIKQLQQELHQARQGLISKDKTCEMESIININ